MVVTLLITAVGTNFAVICTDLRVSRLEHGRVVPYDEGFNKHILFHSAGLTACVAYTGCALWRDRGKDVLMYDVLSDAISVSARQALPFGPLILRVIGELESRLPAALKGGSGRAPIELHVLGRHKEFPWPFIAIISNMGRVSPWDPADGTWEIGNFRIHIKMVDSGDLLFGGSSSSVQAGEQGSFRAALASGMNAFNCVLFASRLIELVSRRDPAVGARSASVVFPNEGYVDTALWDPTGNPFTGFHPRHIFENGTTWGPSEFSVDLALAISGHIPPENIFLRSLIYRTAKRSARRRIFRRRRGPKVPGVMGLLTLNLFGTIAKGYDPLGFGEEVNPADAST